MAVSVVLSTTSGEPIYAQIRDQIKQHILEGTLQEGDALPSIRGLARDLGVSVITTTRAYSELAAAGYIANVQGKGSFVLATDNTQERAHIAKQLDDVVHNATVIGIPLNELETMLRKSYDTHTH